jgi:predicted acetyltransferase
MKELRREGVALSALYASTQPLYRKIGFECAGTKHEAVVDPRKIEIASYELDMRPATAADRPAVESFYREHAFCRDGHLDRGLYIWNRTLLARMGTRTYGALAYDGERLEGYVYYRKSGDTPPFHKIVISDIQASTRRGYARLWSFLRDLSTSVVGAITLSTAPNDPAYRVHPHAYFSLDMHFPWMLRVVDPVAALTARGYPRRVDAEVHLALTDASLPENDGRYVLHVRDGKGTVEHGGRGELELDEHGLASMYSGFAAARDCARGSGLDAAAAIFAGPAPWMPDHF